MIELAIADLAFAIALPHPAWEGPLQERYAAFVSTGPAEWQVTLYHDERLENMEAPWVRHDGPVTAFRVAAYAGEINLAQRQAWVSTPSEERAALALERVLAYICMQALPRRGDALLLHAAGIVLHGRGYAFAGPSGAGKTTVAGLAAGHAEVLCDENVVVVGATGDGGACRWELCSTPFWGHSTPSALIRRYNRRVPLAAVYILAQAADFRLTPLSPAEAVLALLTTEKVATERPESAAAWLAAVERLVTAVPVYRLAFRPTGKVWEFLLEAGAGS